MTTHTEHLVRCVLSLCFYSKTNQAREPTGHIARPHANHQPRADSATWPSSRPTSSHVHQVPRRAVLRRIDPDRDGVHGLRLIRREISPRYRRDIRQDRESELSPPDFWLLDHVGDIVRRYGPLPEPCLSRVCLHTLRALAYLRERHLVHRDLKPQAAVVVADVVVAAGAAVALAVAVVVVTLVVVAEPTAQPRR